MNSIIAFLARHALGQKVLALLARPGSFARGHRTELLVALECLIFVLRVSGVLDTPELSKFADNAELLILGALPITLAEKVKRGQEIAEKIIPPPPAK